MNYLRKIKWAYQRVVRGYDDRIFWGFDEYFEQAIPPLKEFCKNYLTLSYCDLNPERKKVFETTLRMIESFENCDYYTDIIIYEGLKSQLFEYVGRHISWYWD